MIKVVKIASIIVGLWLVTTICSAVEVAIDTATELGEALSADIVNGEDSERIDLRTGRLSLQNIDVVVPGNGGQDIIVGRAYKKNPRPNYGVPHSIGNWELDIPRISGNVGKADFCANPRPSQFTVVYNTVTLRDPYAYVSKRDFDIAWSGLYVTGVDRNYGYPYLDVTEYVPKGDERFDGFRSANPVAAVYIPIEQVKTPTPVSMTRPYYGLTISIPGEGVKDLLKPLQTEFLDADYITADFWKVQCISKDGVANAGFSVVSPKGDRYTFDKSYIVNTAQQESWRYVKTTLIKSAENLKNLIHYYPSKVEDYTGNYLTYTYVTDANNALHLKQINSSDNRVVDFNYNSDAYSLLDTIQANGDVWSYNYYPGTDVLESVILPDNTSWNYTYTNSLVVLGQEGENISTVTNPTGGKTTYHFTEMRVDYFGGRTNDAKIFVIKDKSISGPHVIANKWTYSFDKGDIYNRTRVVSLNRLEEYLFHNIDDYEFGALISTRIYESTDDLSLINSFSEIDETKLTELESAYYSWVQLPKIGRTGADVASLVTKSYPRIFSSKTVFREQSLTFHSIVYYNHDIYGNPMKIREHGSVYPTIKDTDYTYNINEDKWILHRIEDETISDVKYNIDIGYYGKAIRHINRLYNPVTDLLESTNTDGRVEGYTYHSTGDLHQYTDQNGVISVFEQYKRGTPQLITKSTNKKGTTVINQVVNDKGFKDSITVGEKTTGYAYDWLGRVTAITKPDITSNITNINYQMTPNGYTKTTSRGGYQNISVFDGFGRLVSKTEDGNELKYEYDKLGRLFKSYLPNSNEAYVMSYDALSRIKKIKSVPAADAKETTYNYLGYDKVEVIDTRNKKSTYTYEAYGDVNEKYLIGIERENAVSIDITRDVLGNIQFIEQGLTKREYVYDTRNLLDYTIEPEIGKVDLFYDDVGNLITKEIVNNNSITTFTYDGLNRIDYIDYPSFTNDVDYEYYPNGSLHTVNNVSTQWRYEYDDNNNLKIEEFDSDVTSSTDPLYSIHRGYNANDSLSHVIYPSGYRIDYSPDNLGRADQVLPLVNNIDYYANGKMELIEYANGVITNYTQDLKQRVGAIEVNGVYRALVDMHYLYDHENNTTNIEDQINSFNTLSLDYDGVNRLTWVNGLKAISYQTNGNIANKLTDGKNLIYAYDGVSNRLTDIKYNGQNVYNFGYDARGNVTANGNDTFVYNDIDQLISVTSKGIDYSYDGNGNRYETKKTDKNTISIYSINGSLMYEKDIIHGSSSDYVYVNNMLIAKRETCQEIDSDSDGLIDCIESRIGLDINNPNDANQDLDGDGLTNAHEITLGINPKIADSDNDGIPDGFEVKFGLNPLVNDAAIDLDLDGLTNLEEYLSITNPNLADTDFDGVNDADELAAGTNPNFNIAAFIPILNLILN